MTGSKKTMIVGASNNPGRYAYLAASMLLDYGHPIVPVGIKKGEIFGHPILDIRQLPMIKEVDTITLYIGPQHQAQWYDYLIGIKPQRIIFNPGTENGEFEKKLEDNGIEAVQACTLVLLRTNQF